MAEKELGPGFALHGGGMDLVFPHHENEIAQTEGARGVPLARGWMHNGMVTAGPEAKMAKSEGNVFALHEALERFGPEAILAFMVAGHYRQPLAFSAEALEQAHASNERIRDFFRAAERVDGDADETVAQQREAFFAALADDFSTPRAMAAVFDLISEGNRRPLAGAHEALAEMLGVLGLGGLAEDEAVDDPEAERMLAEREDARASGDFERADRLRDELAERGFDVRDTPGGVRLVPRA
jgi:cysteinyl-tRNA synthetase